MVLKKVVQHRAAVIHVRLYVPLQLHLPCQMHRVHIMVKMTTVMTEKRHKNFNKVFVPVKTILLLKHHLIHNLNKNHLKNYQQEEQRPTNLLPCGSHVTAAMVVAAAAAAVVMVIFVCLLLTVAIN